MSKVVISLVFVSCLAAGMGCSKRASIREGHVYTQIDSLTDTYLNLQDSLLITWNVMVKDENEKLRAMHELLQSMNSSGLFAVHEIQPLEERLEQVERIRFNQRTMSNPHVVEEYDFASNSLISEVVTLAESNVDFAQKRELQNLIDYIKVADQRVEYFRSAYDDVAQRYNLFVDKYQTQMKEIDHDSLNEKRPLFQMASDN